MESMEDRADRLAEVALEMAERVRSELPEDVADWLMSITDERDRFDLLFVAVAPLQRKNWQRGTAWLRQREEDVDEVAVMRACNGEVLPLNRRERAAAVAKLTSRGVSAKQIAGLLRISSRQVSRLRGAA
jgi:hypothetical protein